MNECVNSHATIKIECIIKSISSDFYFKNDMQEKETITSNWYGWKFPALGWLFLQYLGRTSVPGKLSLPRPVNILSALVTGERFL